MTIDPRVAREIVIFFRQACLFVLLVPVAEIAWIAMSITWSVLATDHFYHVHPILQAMRDAGEGPTENSPSAREALSRHVPIGTDAATAVADLAGEGFGCAKQPPSSEERVVCGCGVQWSSADGQTGRSSCILMNRAIWPGRTSRFGMFFYRIEFARTSITCWK